MRFTPEHIIAAAVTIAFVLLAVRRIRLNRAFALREADELRRAAARAEGSAAASRNI